MLRGYSAIEIRKSEKKTGAYCFNISYTTFQNKYRTIIQINGFEKQKNSEVKSHLLEVFSVKVDFAI